jgi:hypothetical protein
MEFEKLGFMPTVEADLYIIVDKFLFRAYHVWWTL